MRGDHEARFPGRAYIREGNEDMLIADNQA